MAESQSSHPRESSDYWSSTSSQGGAWEYKSIADMAGFSESNFVNPPLQLSGSGRLDPVSARLVRKPAKSTQLSTSSQMFYYMNPLRKTPV